MAVKLDEHLVLGDDVMIDVLTYMVGGVSILAIVLLTILVYFDYSGSFKTVTGCLFN